MMEDAMTTTETNTATVLRAVFDGSSGKVKWLGMDASRMICRCAFAPRGIVAAATAMREQLMLLLADLRLHEDLGDSDFANALNDHAPTKALAPSGGWQPVSAKHLALAFGLYRRPGRGLVGR